MATQVVSGISGLPIYAPSAGTAQYDEWGNRISSYYATVTDLDVLGQHVIEFNESAMDTRATVSANSANWGQGGGGGVEYLSSQASAVLVQGESSNRIGTFPRDLFIQGRGNTAGGIAMAQGSNNNAYGYSLAQGGTCTANSTSLAQGLYCTAKSGSVALGTLSRASATSFAQGRSVSATNTSFAQGEYLKASSHAQVFGTYNNISSNAFVIADGSADTARHDAFVVYEGASPSAGICSAKAFYDENGPVGGLSTASSNLPDGRTLLNVGSASFVYNPAEVEVGGGAPHIESGTAATSGICYNHSSWPNGPIIWDISELTAAYGTAASISGSAALDILITQWNITALTADDLTDQNITYRYTGSSISSEGNVVAHFTGKYTGAPYSASLKFNRWIDQNSAFATASITGSFAGTQKISACVVGSGPKYNEEIFAGYWNGSSIYQVMLSAAWNHTTTGYLNTAILNGSAVSAFTNGAPVWIDNANSYTIHGTNYCGTMWFFGTAAAGSREGSIFINNAANPAVYVRQFDNTTSNYSAFLVLKYPKA